MKKLIIILLFVTSFVQAQFCALPISQMGVAINTDFVSTWRTATNNETITVPTRSGFAYECDVDWGDGNVEIMSGYDDAKWTHAYVDSGDYEVTIEGTFETFYFNNAGDKLKLISISNLGFVGWASFEKAFYGCTSLNSVTGDADTSLVTSMYKMFQGCSSMTTAPATATWDTSLVTSMSFMFCGCNSMTTAPTFSTTNSVKLANVSQMFSSIGSGMTGTVTEFWDTNNFPNITSYGSFATGATGLDNYADIPDAWKGL